MPATACGILMKMNSSMRCLRTGLGSRSCLPRPPERHMSRSGASNHFDGSAALGESAARPAERARQVLDNQYFAEVALILS